MKPTFALDFRNEAITLLHRTARGWNPVGHVPLDAPDLVEALGYLRSTALGLSPHGLTTKLVIPNSQVLYTTLRAVGPEPARRRKQVIRGLEGLTPYSVEDLVFDISGTGPEVQVAVLARETLAEAEAFAAEHRFNPVSFVAVPEDGVFTGEPWFGPTSLAPKLLAVGQKVERDQTPLVILSRDLRDSGVPEAAPAVSTPPDAAIPAVPEPAVEDPVQAATTELAAAPLPPQAEPAEDLPPVTAGPAPAAAEPQAPEPQAPAPEQDLPAAEPVPADASGDLTELPAAAPDLAEAAAAEPLPADEPPVSDPVAADTVAADTVEAPAVDPQPQIAATLEPEEALAQALSDPEPAAPTLAQPVELPAAVVDSPVEAAPPAVPPVDEAPMAIDVVDDLPDDLPPSTWAQPPQPSVTSPSIPDDVPSLSATSVMMAFASRRAAAAAAKDAAAKTAGPKAGVSKPASGKAPALGAVTAIRNASRTGAVPAPRPTLPDSVSRSQNPRPSLAAVPNTGSAAALAKPQPATPPKPGAKSAADSASAAGKALRGLGALVTAPGIAGVKQRRPVVQANAAAATVATSAPVQTAKPAPKPYGGGLGNRTLEQRGKPRYLGLILTGILLVFLALVAAWSTFFMASRTTDTPQTVVGEAAPADVTTPDASPAPEDEMLADLQDPADFPPPDPPVPDVAASAEPVATEPVATEPVAAEPVVAEPAPDTAITTETAAAPAPAPDPQDEIFLAAMDAAPQMPDALSLPQPAAQSDPPPGPAVPPPPFGTVYKFDADGNIVPTPEGIMTPEGVLLVAGAPKLVPPPRPANLAPPAAAAPDAATLAAPAAATPLVPAAPAPEATFVADPALAGARPWSRPANLVPPTQNADDDASLAPPDDSRFASLRPRVRPAELFAAASASAASPTQADLGAQAASLTAQASLASATGALSPLALTVSRKPAPRPKDFSSAVEAAVAAATRAPDPTPEPRPEVQPETTATNTAPEADAEPEVATAMPRLPTRASVAKQATFANAINLSKTNLIGVYGTQSNRYAMVRQSNGRYKKVKVGDSFDGGRVAAITASELRYQKSGKMHTLALPKS